MPRRRFKLSLEEAIKKAEQGILDDSNIDEPPEGWAYWKVLASEEESTKDKEEDTSEKRRSA